MAHESGARPAAGGSRDLVFVSYAHEDSGWVQRFDVLLRPLVERKRLRLWTDRAIPVGRQWRAELEAAIGRSRAALLLVSADFLASEFITRHELPALMRHSVLLAPVLVGECRWDEVAALESVQWLHDVGEGPLGLDVKRPGRQDQCIRAACDRLMAALPAEDRLGDDAPPTAPAGRATSSAADTAELLASDRLGGVFGVPALPPGYVARAELERAVEMLLKSRARDSVGVTASPADVGLAGMGGIGKSVLAAALALDDRIRRRFPDGIYWVTVGKAGSVLAAHLELLARLDPTAPRPRSPEEARRTLGDALWEQDVLIIVDDVWSDAAALAFQLVGPRGRLVFTTRDPQVLHAVGAQAIAVDVLSLEIARTLARALTLPHPLPESADLAIEQVGRVALAVALLAAAARGGLSWERIAAELVRDAGVFARHPYANAFKALQIAVATLPADLAEALLSLAVFPADLRIPVTAVARYWAHTRGRSAAGSLDDLEHLTAAKLLTLNYPSAHDDRASAGVHDSDPGVDVARSIEFHDLQYSYLLLHAPALPWLHGQLLDAYRDQLPAQDRDQWWRLPPTEPYIRDFLVTHLHGAGARDELAATVTDPAGMLYRVAAGLPVAEADLALAHAALPDDLRISWWQEWLPRHADQLAIVDTVPHLDERVRMLAPTLRAWLDVDTTRPHEVDPARVDPLCPIPHLAVHGGLTSPATALTRVLVGHIGRVTDVAWSPGGTHLATGGGDRTVRIWDATTGRETRLLTGHGDWVTGIAWSPDGMHLATGSDDTSARIWDPATGAAIRTFSQHEAPVTALAWSPDGTRLATGGDDTTVRIWDPTTGRVTRLLSGHGDRVTGIAWSPDGTHLATSGNDRTVRVWRVATGHAIRVFEGHTRAAAGIAWSPDGTRLAANRLDHRVRVWDVTTGRTVYLLRHVGLVTGVAWSPDGTHLATTGSDHTVRVWSAATGRAAHVLAEHTDWTTGLAWSPDGTRLATASNDATIRIWNLATAPSGHSGVDGDDPVVGVAWAPDGRRVATTRGDAVLGVRDLVAGTTVRIRTDHTGPVTGVAWSPDGARLATAGADGTIQISDIATSSTLRSIPTLSREASGVAWAPDGTRIAAIAALTVWIWDATGRVRHTLTGDAASRSVVAWSPDGTRLAVSLARTVRIWNAAPFRSRSWSRLPGAHQSGPQDYLVRPNGARRSLIRALTWSPDSRYLALGWSDGYITMHDTGHFRECSRLRAGSSITGLSWGRDRIAAACSGELVLFTWVDGASSRA